MQVKNFCRDFMYKLHKIIKKYIDFATHETKPSAWLVPQLVDFTTANRIHFSLENGGVKSKEMIMAEFKDTVKWEARIFCDKSKGVTDRFGVTYYPVPLFKKIKNK